MKIEVFGKEGCSYCLRAKALLEDKGLEYTYLAVEDEGVLDELASRTSARKMPQIFFDGAPIGGFDQLREWFKSEPAS